MRARVHVLGVLHRAVFAIVQAIFVSYLRPLMPVAVGGWALPFMAEFVSADISNVNKTPLQRRQHSYELNGVCVCVCLY